MLSTVKTLTDYKLDGIHGEIGKVKEFHFDDRFWTIRYLVADTGEWLSSKKVVISPYSLENITDETRSIGVDLTIAQIENCPELGAHEPISRQFEDNFYGYYGWPLYWDGPYAWGENTHLRRDVDAWSDVTHDVRGNAWASNLRSSVEVTGYQLEALDGEIGHIEDFIVDDETWAIRYLIVSTQNWLPGKRVLISPIWMTLVSWSESKAYVDLTREQVQNSPEFTNGFPILRDYEARLHAHYDRSAYWMAAPSLEPVEKLAIPARERKSHE